MPLRRIRIRPRALLAALALLLLAAAGSAAAVDGPSAPDGGERLLPHVFPALLADSVENTSVIAQNDGEAPSVMVMDFHTPAGVLIPAASQVFTDVPRGGSRTFAHALNGGLVPNFRGVGALSSDQPMNALLAREITGPDGQRSYSLHTASARGGTRVVLPYVANRLEDVVEGDKVNTRLAIANASERTACVQLTYAFFPGRGKVGPEGQRTVRHSWPRPRDVDCRDRGFAIPPNGQITFAPTRVDGALPMPAQARNTLAAVTIDSTEMITVAADVYHRDGPRLAAYDGFLVGTHDSDTDDVSTHMVLPIALKTADGLWTEYALANPWPRPTTARITYRGMVGEARTTVTVDVEVPAGGARGHSMFDLADLPTSFRGSAVVESSQPLAVVLLRGKMTEAGSFEHEPPYAAVNGVPADRASREAKLPLIARNAGGGDDRDGLSTSVSVAVAGGGTANLRIRAENDPSAGCGDAATVYTTTVTVRGSMTLDQGSDDPRLNGLNAVPDCLRGGMTITSDREIVVVAGVTSDLGAGDNDALYNAFASR